MRDLHNSIEVLVALNQTIINVTGTTNGNVIDRYTEDGYESLEFLIHVGANTAGSYTVNVQDGAASDLSDAADVAAAGLLGAEPTFDSADDNVVKKVGYIGEQRYVRIQIVATVAATGADSISALAVLGHPRHGPEGAVQV